MPRLHYLEQGSGTPVILIHGFCETHQVWKLVDRKLSEYNRVIGIDLPGFGKSEPLSGEYSIDRVAETVIDFLRHDLKIESCIAMGHSLGGYIVLAMAEKSQELFKGIGLIHSTALADTTDRKIAREKVIDFVEAHGVKPFIDSFIPPLFHDKKNHHITWMTDLARKTPLDTLRVYTRAMKNRPDRTSVLKNFAKPVLFLAGQEDTIIPAWSVAEQVGMCQKPYSMILPEVAHMGMLEDEERCYKTMHDFISALKSHS